MPVAPKLEKLTTPNRSDLRQLEIQVNNLTSTVAAITDAFLADNLYGWYGLGANSTGLPMARGSTDTQVGLAATVVAIAGVPIVTASSAGGTTFGSLGTIPTGTWGLIALDRVAAGTVTFRSAAASFTTGYATEALAIAARPARITLKAELGYVTILAASPGWAAATDALAGGSSGVPATTTNYYPNVGIMAPTGVATGPNGVVCCGLYNGVGSAVGSPWTGGKNGVRIASTLSRGTTVTLASSAFTFNAGGMTNIPKAATTATSIGALGTIPADKWGLVAALIDGAAAITFISAPANYTTGYNSEQQAIGDLVNMYPAVNLCFFAFFTVKTKAATAFIFATDSLAGGATGNVASATNYYSVPGITIAEGLSASLLANRSGQVLTSVQY